MLPPHSNSALTKDSVNKFVSGLEQRGEKVLEERRRDTFDSKGSGRFLTQDPEPTESNPLVRVPRIAKIKMSRACSVRVAGPCAFGHPPTPSAQVP